MTVIYQPWTPIEGIPSDVDWRSVHDDCEGFRIILSAEGGARMLRILFESPLAYESLSESFRLLTWEAMAHQQSLPSLLTVEGSPWIAGLKKEAGGVMDDLDVKHYAVYTSDYCIDVASVTPPRVEWLGESGE